MDQVLAINGRLQSAHGATLGKTIQSTEFLPLERDAVYPAMLMLRFSDGSGLAVPVHAPLTYMPAPSEIGR